MSLKEASRFWLQLGLVSFGGPAGQIALLHRELVDRRRWLSERRFLHALNYCMVLPGPEATQLATYLGWLMNGVPGGLIAGGLFLAPSVLLLTTLATAYALWGQLPLLASVFVVLKPAVLAIVLVAAWRLGQRALRTPLLIGIATAAFLSLAVLRLPYPLVVVGAALSGLVAGRWRPGLLFAPTPPSPATQLSASTTETTALPQQEPVHGDQTSTPEHCRFSRRHLALILLVWGLAILIPLALLAAVGGWSGTLAVMARFFTRVALLSFGGAYAVLPYVAQGAVEQFGWLNASQMLDGLALGETTPGPLIMVVAFVGFMGGWNRGLGNGLADGIGDAGGSLSLAISATLVTVWFTFLPSFGFILTGAPLVEASRGDLRFGAPLTAITAAVVGVIGSLAAFFSGPVLWPLGAFSPTAALVVALGLLAQLKWRWSVLQVIGAAAASGACWAGLAQLVS
ncbi:MULTISPECIES: chromate efflux transporter [unclassified Cyanobium]|uniref:chromate efflux transporter n=1 Tax=unclassified Cyanobium TaxID=2627006 RepID=UPI0020CC3828|nr:MULTISPECIES: chromate efflux transporter [unclassified Cyanobium]MCP9777402.1 chromate efflux transporter [Cyanobium sp. Tous-M-B4]MCP9876357.1 chromate efflux transporter [Cyanobium sp. A2C-AMD]